jgi:hypothetical protein
MNSTKPVVQVTLGDKQIAAFNTDRNASEQAARFIRFSQAVGGIAPGRFVVDVGGGNGYFARELHARTGWSVRVIDSDEKSIDGCKALAIAGVEAVVGDAIAPQIRGDEGAAAFNLVLHHLIGRTEADTAMLQEKSLRAWRGRVPFLMVSEISYDSLAFDLTGKVIFAVTSSKLLSKIAGVVGKFVPSLRANTLGVGVRFRSKREWLSFFDRSGYRVLEVVEGEPEPISIPLRFLFVKQIRSDFFLLVAK